MNLPSDLRAFIESLNAARVKYVIVGGYAVAFHGYPRFTGDMDFFVDRSLENAVQLVEALQQFGFGGIDLRPRDMTAHDVVVQLGYPPNRIDLMTSIDGVAFAEAWATRVAVELDGVPTAFISKELLLTNKRCAGRPKDVADVDAL